MTKLPTSKKQQQQTHIKQHNSEFYITYFPNGGAKSAADKNKAKNNRKVRAPSLRWFDSRFSFLTIRDRSLMWARVHAQGLRHVEPRAPTTAHERKTTKREELHPGEARAVLRTIQMLALLLKPPFEELKRHLLSRGEAFFFIAMM